MHVYHEGFIECQKRVKSFRLSALQNPTLFSGPELFFYVNDSPKGRQWTHQCLQNWLTWIEIGETCLDVMIIKHIHVQRV